MNVLRSLMLAVLLLSSVAIQAGEFDAKVIAVLDGDTLLVMRGSNPVKLRLAEIDAPEVAHAGTGERMPDSQKAQPYGTESQKSLAELVMGQRVQVVSRAVDSYGRIVAMVSINGLNVNHEQVRRGLAWEYSRFHSNKALMALQHEAQQARRGLWAANDNIEPSQWRKQHPSTLPAAVKPGVSAVPAARPLDSRQGCDKKNCSGMGSCAEAKSYFARCGGAMLDGDGDGKPCEKLCAAEGGKPR